MYDDPTLTAQPPTADANEPAGPVPPHIARYRIERILGSGTFGVVYLAFDDVLQRPVAIKVPHRHLVARPQDAAAYLAEARLVAQFNHPHIVPVYDSGHTADCPFYVVSMFVAGTTLARKIADDRPGLLEAAGLVAAVAGALQHAHRHGVVHRDVKPGNILLDPAGAPFVADFGLALRRENVGRGPVFAGTPAYMSPEQARREGHRVDGRSDVFSLGVVFYELLTGTRPFQGDTQSELLNQIRAADPPPPRQFADGIPPELERICLKALAKRAAERYPTAQAFADDLRHFLVSFVGAETVPVAPHPPPSPPPSSANEAVQVVPKGLRSFDARDADFFLGLLPGPRDRDGLPETLRFWKTRIEDAEDTFTVGLIYGPSGCGKSSFVKAGLLPRLSHAVTTVYVEATADGTEARLLNGLRKRFPALPTDAPLTDVLTELRTGPHRSADRKVLVVLDQFEQWLHTHPGTDTELVRALRHCDGGRVQCVVLVRDDFWLPVSRFMRELEVDLVPDRNVALVDLFDSDHARTVLAAFGRAYGKLPAKARDVSRDQAVFLDRAVAGLAQGGQVICVRLAVFADMMKGRPWTPAALAEVGGTEGVGVAFLEDTFSSAAANPRHRRHQAAARGVLQVLLPAAGDDIKGNMRSEAELRSASGYAHRPAEFDDLVKALDGDVRLITPTDPEGADRPGEPPGERYYQLTHDYLVHSLRDWLTRKQRETRRGRAELRLADRAAVWARKPERRHLPAVTEWARIRVFTRRRTWTPPQRQMMRAADRHYLTRGVLTAAVLLLAGWGTAEWTGRTRADNYFAQLKRANVDQVPGILEEMGPYRRRVEILVRAADAGETDDWQKLKYALVLVRSDPGQVDGLVERLLDAGPQDFVVIRDELARYKDRVLADHLWGAMAAANPGRKFRAACALAAYDGDNAWWEQEARAVVGALVAENPQDRAAWMAALAPVRESLFPALACALEDAQAETGELRDLIELYRGFSRQTPTAAGRAALEARLPAAGPDPAGARKGANVGAALVALDWGQKVWPLLRHTPDPTLRSYLIERFQPAGVGPDTLAARLAVEPDPSAGRALILALGNYPAGRTTALDPILTDKYETTPDPGTHAAAGWALRTWGRGARIDAVDSKLATEGPVIGRDWYVNNAGLTFVVIKQPVGGPKGQGVPALPRLAVAATEVTVAQFEAAQIPRILPPRPKYDPRGVTPVTKVSWDAAAEYCNWLSGQDGIPVDQHCYCKDGERFEFVPDYRLRQGYRLATEAEWEAYCLAGAETDWHFGVADRELLGAYSRWLGNGIVDGPQRPFRVATRKPNDWGLFDTHGNVNEWCQESPAKERVPETEKKRFEEIETAFRGGAYDTSSPGTAVTYRGAFERRMSSTNVGFRVVRGVPGP